MGERMSMVHSSLLLTALFIFSVFLGCPRVNHDIRWSCERLLYSHWCWWLVRTGRNTSIRCGHPTMGAHHHNKYSHGVKQIKERRSRKRSRRDRWRGWEVMGDLNGEEGVIGGWFRMQIYGWGGSDESWSLTSSAGTVVVWTKARRS